MTVTFRTAFQHTGGSVLVSAAGDLDAAAEPSLSRALGSVPPGTAVVIFDMRGVPFMDSAGLLLFLDLHRRAEHRGLKVLVVGWQSQPQQVMEVLAGLPGGKARPRERAALIGFRRMVEERAERQRQLAWKAPAATDPRVQPVRHGGR
ncbi:STAS domain-containing protein [Streptomyces sp. NPDC058620]|uniref:STAS domain-containing protein n=1 Tax=Streptomyces sp. NPDC058620 TaxID=3346560 RepID=UPI0036532AD1